MRLVKMDEYGHDFAGAQTSLSLSLYFACRKHLLSPNGYKELAKIIDIAKKFG